MALLFSYVSCVQLRVPAGGSNERKQVIGCVQCVHINMYDMNMNTAGRGHMFSHSSVGIISNSLKLQQSEEDLSYRELTDEGRHKLTF